MAVLHAQKEVLSANKNDNVRLTGFCEWTLFFVVVIYGSHIEYVYDICTQKREILTEHSQLASPTMITTVIHLLLNDKRRNKYVSGDLPLSTHADLYAWPARWTNGPAHGPRGRGPHASAGQLASERASASGLRAHWSINRTSLWLQSA